MSFYNQRYCKDCRWAEFMDDIDVEPTEMSDYECHCNPPTLVDSDERRIFPVVNATDWCSRFEYDFEREDWERRNGR